MNIRDQRGGKLDVGTEKDIGPLGRLPQREECPICMQVLPTHTMLQTYASCRGKIVCGGCDLQHKTKNKGRSRTCAFCRTAAPESDGEILEQLRKRVELKDPAALINLAMAHGRGELGLPVNQATCVQLLRQAAGLDCPAAKFGEMGLRMDEGEALRYMVVYPQKAGTLMHGTILGAQKARVVIMLLQCVTFDCLRQGGSCRPWAV